MTRAFVYFALLLVASACDGDTSALLVDLRTDYVPGLDFVTVEVSATPSGATTELPSSRTVSSRDSFLPVSSRVAEYRGIPAGLTSVRVRLRSRGGAFIGEGRVVIDVQGQVGVTVVITRSCMGVECPLDDPGATTCWGGRCVTPDCRPGDLTSCGEPRCASDAECTSVVACAVGRCVDGVCFEGRDDSRCGATEICDPAVGCVGVPIEDAGMPDGALPDAADTGTDDAAMPLARESFLAEANRLTCEISIACHNRNGLGSLILDAACHPTFTTPFTLTTAPWLAAFAATGYDEDAARACLVELAAYDDCVRQLPAVCFRALPGTLANGSACSAPNECQSGECREASVECRFGTCVAAGGAGAACDVMNPCTPGLACLAGACQSFVDDGDDCSAASCGPGLVCEADRCRPGPRVGESCSIPVFGRDPCAEGSRCVSGNCTVAVPPGGACGAGSRCAGGARCEEDICRLTVGPGGRCSTTLDCPIFFHCESDTCQPDPVIGDACGGAAGSCVEGVCRDDTCQLGRAGDACSASLSGIRVCEGACARGVCQAPIPLRDACPRSVWACGEDAFCDGMRSECIACP